MEAAATLCRIQTPRITQDYFARRNPLHRKCSLPLAAPIAAQGLPLLTRRWPQTSCSNINRVDFSTKIGNKAEKNLLKCEAAELTIAPTEDAAGMESSQVGKESVKVREEEELSRATLIWRAAKLPMYTVALIPVTVASAAAYYQTGVFSLGRYLTILACYVIINVWVNLSNDVYDFDTGADKDKKESVVNLFGSRNGINFIAWSLLALGFSGLTMIAAQTGSLRPMVFIAAAVFGFYLYQCPPFRLSYYGVGEPLLFLAYGPFSTLGFYLLNSIKNELPISGTVLWSSILIGLTTSLILFCSHFHQIKGDRAAGKISPLVRLGTERGSHVVKWSILGLYTFVLILGMTNTLPFASVLLCALTLPMGGLVVNFVQKNHRDNSKIFMGKYLCVRLHTIFGAALAAGLVAARSMAKQVPLQAVVGL
ncbi:2-carboxy-1,4-naphthoquinone phytyltransferase, chloroplastic-like [Andrographis paniculata]|uniref:2-carboxy-1,4-naphthoquinone phytyltransferase, chloroplastic-like n=1 Tax=Andrographis paniculata TaxID=175694 RepID=UPI0021E9588F|nr:2-carboxy-1,4-naphthoquinone phytyltransferase, chloroplastic-like [Andrographis paniculata]